MWYASRKSTHMRCAAVAFRVVAMFGHSILLRDTLRADRRLLECSHCCGEAYGIPGSGAVPRCGPIPTQNTRAMILPSATRLMEPRGLNDLVGHNVANPGF
jgi:hypothetical protein